MPPAKPSDPFPGFMLLLKLLIASLAVVIILIVFLSVFVPGG
jgi:hypothetical protein